MNHKWGYLDNKLDKQTERISIKQKSSVEHQKNYNLLIPNQIIYSCTKDKFKISKERVTYIWLSINKF